MKRLQEYWAQIAHQGGNEYNLASIIHSFKGNKNIKPVFN